MKTNITKQKARRGFACMNPELQREICKKGGKAISRDRKHMARIGRLGGLTTGKLLSAAAKANKEAA